MIRPLQLVVVDRRCIARRALPVLAPLRRVPARVRGVKEQQRVPRSAEPARLRWHLRRQCSLLDCLRAPRLLRLVRKDATAAHALAAVWSVRLPVCADSSSEHASAPRTPPAKAPETRSEIAPGPVTEQQSLQACRFSQGHPVPAWAPLNSAKRANKARAMRITTFIAGYRSAFGLCQPVLPKCSRRPKGSRSMKSSKK